MKINSQKDFIVGGVVALIAIVLVAGGAYYIGAYKTSDKTIQDTTPYINTVSIIDTPIENGLILTGKNFSTNQSVYINVSSNAAANFFPNDLNKIVVSENGTKLQIKSLNLVKGKTYIVRVINNIDSFLFNGAGENDSNEISITVPSNNKVGDISLTSDWKTYKNEKYGFEFNYPQNYATLNRDTSNGFIAMFRDQSKVFPNPDVANLIMIDASSAKNEVSFENYIKKYPRVSGNTNRPYEFTPRTLGKNTFYYTLTERFEGTLSFMYCILNNDTVSCFHSESNGVDWTNQDLDVDSDSTHAALRSILATLKFTSPTNAVQSKEQKLISTSREVLTALKNKDYNKLETLSSKDGLSFNENSDSLDLSKNDVSKDAISEIPKNTTKYMWGYTDGKGDEIRLTLSDYINQWMYNRDYINAPKIMVNQIAYPQGNTPNYIATYSQGRNYVAFHFDSTKEYPGLTWSTMYLIFDEENKNYKLRGIIKANWTI